MSIFFSILFFSILFFVFHPLFNTYNYLNDDSNDQNIYRNNLLNQIKDLEFEKEMGIISDDDYNFIKNSLLQEISKYIEN
tara:strand:+ start:821 stop:1060 length:240 start_codon:yes stop_codon:yes gene_type:complete